jgi:hypothetical protein
MMEAGKVADVATHRTVILVYRTVGDTEMICTKIQSFEDCRRACPIDKKDADDLLRDYMKSAFTMLSDLRG